MAKHKPAGGIKSRVVTERPVRTGMGARKINERGVSQIGQSLGDHITERRGTVNPVERVRAGAMGGMGNVPLGNATAKSCGPRGEGRTLYGQAGSQKMYGAANPGNAPAKNTDILRQFGPDVPGRR